MKIRCLIFTVLLFFLNMTSIFSLEFYSKSKKLRWTIDTTLGRQFFDLISQENGENVENNFTLETKGLLFHSFYKNHLISRASLDFGFIEAPNFSWSDSPNIVQSDEKFNDSLKSVEFEYQIYLPKIGKWFINFLPFGGFSFVNYIGENIFSSDTFRYLSLSAGIQYFHRFNSHFSHTYYFSYSPMMTIEHWKYEKTIHYLNFGGEIITNLHPVSITLFVIFRKIYDEFRDALFITKNYTINTSEIGFSFKLDL